MAAPHTTGTRSTDVTVMGKVPLVALVPRANTVMPFTSETICEYCVSNWLVTLQSAAGDCEAVHRLELSHQLSSLAYLKCSDSYAADRNGAGRETVLCGTSQEQRLMRSGRENEECDEYE